MSTASDAAGPTKPSAAQPGRPASWRSTPNTRAPRLRMLQVGGLVGRCLGRGRAAGVGASVEPPPIALASPKGQSNATRLNEVIVVQEIYPDLWRLQPDDGRESKGSAYLLKRKHGNVLMGVNYDMTAQIPLLEEHGGVSRIFIHDRHMGKAAMGITTDALGLGVTCSAIEAKACHKTVAIAEELPMEEVSVLPDLKVVPTPGHTRGALSHIWENGEHRYLFIGDTLVPVEGEWRYWVSKSNTALMIESMRRLQDEDFDVILSNSFGCKPFAWTNVTKKEKDSILSGVLASLNSR